MGFVYFRISLREDSRLRHLKRLKRLQPRNHRGSWLKKCSLQNIKPLWQQEPLFGEG